MVSLRLIALGLVVLAVMAHARSPHVEDVEEEVDERSILTQIDAVKRAPRRGHHHHHHHHGKREVEDDDDEMEEVGEKEEVEEIDAVKRAPRRHRHHGKKEVEDDDDEIEEVGEKEEVEEMDERGLLVQLRGLLDQGIEDIDAVKRAPMPEPRGNMRRRNQQRRWGK